MLCKDSLESLLPNGRRQALLAVQRLFEALPALENGRIGALGKAIGKACKKQLIGEIFYKTN